MDVFDLDNIKAEKTNALLRYNRLKNIKKLFRLVELFLGLVLLSWTSSRLPFAVKLSGEYFRQFVSIILSPLFIFIICNAIILALLYKSGHFSPISITTTAATEESDELYEELISITSENCTGSLEEKPEPEEIIYEDKETIFEANTINGNCEEIDVMGINESEKGFTKMYLRTKSENLGKRDINLGKKSCGNLRRSKTEKYESVTNCGGQVVTEPPEAEYVFDRLSNEEFQRTIEAFIAKQVKFHQEEKLAIVLHTQA